MGQWRRLQRRNPTPKVAQSKDEPAWSSIQKTAEEASCCLEVAIQMLQDDQATFKSRALQALRDRLLENLLKASGHTCEFFSKLLQLKIACEKEGMKQTEVYGNFGTQLPEEKLCKINEETGSSALDVLREENLKLREDLQAVKQENAAKFAVLEEAQENCACALEQVKKHKEVIARTTADNMLFLMKLKQAEEDLQSAEKKHDDLKKQVVFYRSTWLEEASAEIEDAVRSSLDKAQACESKLQKFHKQQEIRMQECELKLQELTENLSAINAAKRHLEDRIKSSEEEKMDLVSRLEKETSDRHHLQIQNEGLTSTIDKYTRELVMLTEEHHKLLEDLKVKTADLEGRNNKENEFLRKLESISNQLETQRVMNLTLMKKKEEVEWLCLEAQAEREKLKQQLRELLNS